MSFKKEVITKLEKIEARLTDQTVHLAVYNKELSEHIKRSTMLEERVHPLEQSHVFTSKLLKIIMTVTTFAAAATAVYHYIFIK